jgi:myo-inositol 2-dehydrogenase / D-chiro-inositol 1-dehydrogenase
MSEFKVSRREFVKKSLAAGAGIGVFSIVPRSVLGGPGHIAPSERLTKGIIGLGAMGMGHINLGGTKCLAVCDVDKGRLNKAVQTVGKDCQGYHDYRELLAREDIDIVHIATPPHWHGIMAVEAARAGKDIWLEKPMTRTIGEGIRVAEEVKKYRRILRLNTWFRFKDGIAGGYMQDGSLTAPEVKKLINSGLLGWPLKVTISATTGFNWKFVWSGKADLKPMPVPPELDYDLWLGPAPYKPYNPERVHGKFRGYWDYDGGGLGDMGQHYLDPIQYLLGKDDTSPVTVEVGTPQQGPDAVGPWYWVRLKYADGCEIFLDGENRQKDAAFIEGPNGKYYGRYKSTIPNLKEKMDAMPPAEPQVTDFIDAVRNRKTFALNEQNGHRSCTLINMAKIALRLGRPLQFDPVAQRFIGDEAANRLINQPMRSPWHMIMS